MKDLIELRNTLINLGYLCKGRGNSYRFNYNKRIDFELWKNFSNLWNNNLSYFSSEEELVFYICRPKLTQDTYCQNCGKRLTFEQIKRGNKSCSKKCKDELSHSEEWKRKYKEAWEKKTPEELAEIKSRIEGTMLERYGVRHNWCNGQLREKEKETWLEKYGVDHPLKSKEIRKQIVKSLTDNYEDGNYANRKKAKETCIKTNAYKIAGQKRKELWKGKTQKEIDARTNKIKQTNLEEYGTITPWYLDEGRKKSRKTCLEKYGTEHYSKAEAIKEKKKQTCLKHFGTENPFQSKVVKTTIKERNLERYGCEFPAQSPYIQSKSKKLYNYDNLYFNSSNELYFYIYHKEILKDNISQGKTFFYNFNNCQLSYHCDFLVNDENVEIKGNQYFKDGKLYFPYRTQNKVDWQKKQKQWDAKFECMIKNNVRIILTDSEEMRNIQKEVDKKYTSDFVNLFNIKLEFPYLNPKLTDISDMGLIHHFHKSIYEASRKGKLSPIQAWKDKSLVRDVALNRLKYVGSCRPSDIIQGFNVTLKAPKVSVFNPNLAERLIIKYLSDVVSIVDPFSGFSGRMLASEKQNKKYFGYDINESHVKESNQIKEFKKFFNSNIQVRNVLDNYPIESYDALFTCPPYGGKEHWNENNDEVEKSCDEWINICLDKFSCQKYLFVVDKTEMYKNNIVQAIEQTSHFGNRKEYVVLICKDKNRLF